MTAERKRHFGLPIAIPSDCIATLYFGRFGRFQIVHCSGTEQHTGAAGTTRDYHILVPMDGGLLWHRGANEPVFANAKTILHIESNDNYKVTHPVGAELSAVFWPSSELTEELAISWMVRSDKQPIIHSCNGKIQLALRRLIRLSPILESEFAFEETMIDVMSKIYALAGRNRVAPGKSARVVNRAKEYLHAHLDSHLSLSEIAAATGVSPVYLTQLFSASEGVPLYRYHLDLRLAASLSQLPEIPNITHLALDLGFSSHSHFSTVFLKHFGIPPSEYRASMQASGPVPQLDPRRHLKCEPFTGPDFIPLCEAKGGPARAIAA
jgi:AraC family transcriptional regulator